METVKLTLRGPLKDGNGVYRSYFLVTDGGRNAGRGRATAIPLSIGAPLPQPEFVEVNTGGEEEALSRLIQRLLSLPGNAGLAAELNDTPT